MSEVRVDLLQYLTVLRRWRRTATAIVVIVLLFTALFTFLTDDVYVAEATLLPQVEGGQSPGVSSLIVGQMTGLGSLVPGMATPADVVISMLRSRTLAGWVVDSQDLVTVWGVEGGPEVARTRAVNGLQKKTTILMNENGLIAVRVSDGDAGRAAAVVNAYLDELERANTEFSTSTAAKTREFIENRLNDTREKLAAAQNLLQQFQEEHGALAIDAQTQTTVEVIAGLQGDVEKLRARRDMLLEFHSGDSSEISALDGQIAAMEARIAVLTGGGPEDAGGGVREGVLLELSDVPALTAEYVRLRLAVETQGEVYSLLSKEFEMARIEEQRNTPTIRVLDRAEPPLYPVMPRPKLYLALGFVLGCGLAFMSVLLLDRLAPPEAREMDRLRGLIRRYPALGQT